MGGVDEYHARLKELWGKRTQLMKVRAKKKKKKGRKGRSALKKADTGVTEGDTATNWDDDKTSFMTMGELQ